MFSHYDYFDKVLDLANQDWINHKREAWVWMRDRFVPYPFQNNIQRLPEKDLSKCVKGLVKKKKFESPANFKEWLENGFGPGIMDVFLTPYNRKVWGYDPTEMNVEWMGERVATVNIESVIDNIVTGSDELGWGPNSIFRFPYKGGTGTIWEGLYDVIDSSKFRFDSKVVGVDTADKKIHLGDGTKIDYDYIVSTMPLDSMCTIVKGPEFIGYPELAPKFRYSSTNVIGLGIEGHCPKRLSDKCWMYFPEENCPFYRVTVFSKYSPYNVAKPGQQWSLMFEVCETEMCPVNHETIVDEVIQGAINTKLIKPSSEIVSKYYRRFEHGYPTPFLGRDQLCKPIFENLEKHGIFSRGRFGAWKYEVSNQDHTMMQGVEAVDHILNGSEEMTFRFPGVVNRREWKTIGRLPKNPIAEEKVNYHTVEDIIRKEHPIKKMSGSDSSSGSDTASESTPEPGTPWCEGKLEDAGANIKRIVLVDMDNTLCDWESR